MLAVERQASDARGDALEWLETAAADAEGIMVRPTRASTVINAYALRSLGIFLIGTACVPDALAPQPHCEDRICHVPLSIDPTGVRDVTDELVAYVAGVPDSSTIVLAKDGVYRVEGTLAFQDRHALTFVGNGASIIADTEAHRDRRHWRFIGGSDIEIRGVHVRGAHPNGGIDPDAYRATLEAQHAFEFLGVNGVTLDSVSASDVYGDFIYLGMRRSPVVWTSNVQVRNSRFERNGRHAIALTGVRDAVIEGNWFDQIRYSTIDIEPLGVEGGAQRVRIAANRFGVGRLLFFSAHGIAGLVEDISIERNRIEGGWMQVSVSPPEGNRRARFRILGNVSDRLLTSTKPLMVFRRVDGLIVRDNVHPLAERMNMTGVYVEESCAVDIGGNLFEGAAREMEILPHAGCQ